MFVKPCSAPLVPFAAPAGPGLWLVVFLDPPEPGPDDPLPNRLLARALRLLRPGFRHVLAISPVVGAGDPGRGWLVCNPGARALGLGVAPSHETLRVLRRLVRQGRARCVAVTAREPARMQPRGLFTCVQVVAHLIGVPCHPFATPRGLWRRIAAMRA
ncbi:hypothetical protein [Minwuia thermotolerans]|uniref:Uncharacterized protein n=1 Tax=Minwuia thermotolerans TaxID=2056226 RepID=A0A2M9G141_9PROT|nr:hypothetical protein [Minwuia thermotolerans]PJK29430.1 hypothetical protein CVT23_12580 [Minwuia thermotolerans]